MTNHNAFQMPYIGIDQFQDMDLLYGLNGEFSVVIRIVNPVLQYSGSTEAYLEFHAIFTNLLKIIGSGYLLQKQDIICKSPYPYKPATEFLQDKYNRHFEGRMAAQIQTYLTITRQVKKGSFYTYNEQLLFDFKQIVIKVLAILDTAKMQPRLLAETEVNLLIKCVLGLNFTGQTITLNNISPVDTQLNLGDLSLRSISLIDIDQIELPQKIGVNTELNDTDTIRGFPVDLLSFLIRTPDYHCIIYNQLIEVPEQAGVLRKLTLKRKRHSGIPDPANNLCVDDIDALMNDVARYSQILVNAHFNIIVAASSSKLQAACNFIEAELFNMGITPSQNAYNQLELYRTAIPGNGVELKAYDWFLTTGDAALCFLYKESLPVDDPSDFLIRFTDRQGIPVSICLSDFMMSSGRMVNRNRFICGPSGSGKSYFVNNLIEQYLLYNMDVVIVDVGHSYSGLCAYYGGKYMTYTEQKPITMNPFAISESEYNIEKKDNLITLICLLWRGSEGTVNSIERDVISLVITAYYRYHFSAKASPGSQMNFNSFYDFALEYIPKIKSEEHIPFDLKEFGFLLKKFYKGGEYETLLNEPADESLLSERLVIYEIDSIQGANVMAA